MSSLLTLGRRRGYSAEALPPPPYAIPSAAPYNVPSHLITPTYDGSGSTVHPSVIDFATMHRIPEWRGFRFWMAHTPFPLSDATKENPSILASHDGVTWETPAGLTNPIYPAPATYWNSDTDLSYDATTDELVLVFRGFLGDPAQHFVARSADGVTWPPAPSTLNGWASPEANLSPSLVQLADGSWLMFGIGNGSWTFRRWTAPTPEGPWSEPVGTSGVIPPKLAWHIDVARIGSALYAIIDDGGENEAGASATNAIYVARSTNNGMHWTLNPTPIITLGSGGWDNWDLYRATLAPHENGTHMRVWYCGRKSKASVAESWHIGLTHVPLTEWPAPPA